MQLARSDLTLGGAPSDAGVEARPVPKAGKTLGIAACTAIVVGNMVGSGFYLSPAAVAPYGNLAIVV